jgi:hypothetical protein
MVVSSPSTRKSVPPLNRGQMAWPPLREPRCREHQGFDCTKDRPICMPGIRCRPLQSVLGLKTSTPTASRAIGD